MGITTPFLVPPKKSVGRQCGGRLPHPLQFSPFAIHAKWALTSATARLLSLIHLYPFSFIQLSFPQIKHRFDGTVS